METKKTVGFIGGKFLPFHQGHVYAILEAANQVDELYVVVSSSTKRDDEICKRDGIKPIPAEVRMSWIGESLANLENIKIIQVGDDQGEWDYDWEDGARKIKAAIGKPIDKVFSSETSYNDLFRKNYPEAEHVIVDDKRKTVTISATELRKNLYGNWDKLPASVRGYFTKRVLVTGTESVGKSTLVKQLAKFYNTEFVHEVGRDYCEKFANNLTPSMFDEIAMEHFLLQKRKAEKSNKVLFVDSDAVVTQYYLGMYFPGKRSGLVDEVIKKQNYDLVLYLEPDVPWIADGLRSAGKEEERRKFNAQLKDMYGKAGIEFVTISGDYQQRFRKARTLVDKLFGGSK